MIKREIIFFKESGANNTQATPDTELIAHTLYCFSQGMKVAVEIAVMAADANLISPKEEVIAIGGTGQGADTAIVVKPAYSTNFFDLKIREIIAMPG